MGKMADATPFAALRNDIGAALTMARDGAHARRFWPSPRAPGPCHAHIILQLSAAPLAAHRVLLPQSRYFDKMGPAFLELALTAGGPGGAGEVLGGSLGTVMERAGVTNRWLRQLLDLECFVISGCLAKGAAGRAPPCPTNTIAPFLLSVHSRFPPRGERSSSSNDSIPIRHSFPPADTPSPEMAFMYKERHRPGAILDFPIGGSQAFIDALVRGIEKRGGRVLLGAPVEEVVVEGGRARGVRLAGGKGTVRAGSIVCSTSLWDRLVRPFPPSASCPAPSPRRFLCLSPRTSL